MDIIPSCFLEEMGLKAEDVVCLDGHDLVHYGDTNIIECARCKFRPADHKCDHSGMLIGCDRDVHCADCGLKASLEDVKWKVDHVLHFNRIPLHGLLSLVTCAQAGLRKLLKLEKELRESW
jgi:hypothetical protein